MKRLLILLLISILSIISIMQIELVQTSSSNNLAQNNVVSNHPNMYIDTDEIDAIKIKVQSNQEPWNTAYKKLISDANSALYTPIQSVTYGGKLPPSGNKNDYYSEVPYTQKDGVIDKSVDRTDYNSAIQMGKSVRDLGLAYTFTGDDKYAKKAIELISAWTVNPETRMNPKFIYWDQDGDGKNENRQSQIELSITMPGMFYGADLIWNYDGWNPSDKAEFVSWTSQIIAGAKTWPCGQDTCQNFENWRLVLISSASIITEDKKNIDYVSNRWKEIIPWQMNTTGVMIHEINRSNSLTYSTYSLNAMIQTAEILRHQGIDLYNYKLSDGRGLEKALDFHAQYVANPSTWPFRQSAAYSNADNTALFELAYSFKKKDSYIDAILRWGRPMYDKRTMGWVTLTHADGQTVVKSLSTNTSQTFDVKSYLSKFAPGSQNEGYPHGAAKSHNWYYKSTGAPRIFNSPYNYLNWWGVIYADTSNVHPSNTRVAIKNVKLLLLEQGSNKWKLVQDMGEGLGGSGYPENWIGKQTEIDMRTEPDGSFSFVPKPDYVSHFWPIDPLANVNTGISTNAIVIGQVKLILADPSKPDDRDSSRYIINLGADWRSSDYKCISKTGEGVCPGIGSGRFIYPKKDEWRTIVMSTISLSDLNILPLPSKELFLISNGNYPIDDEPGPSPDIRPIKPEEKNLVIKVVCYVIKKTGIIEPCN